MAYLLVCLAKDESSPYPILPSSLAFPRTGYELSTTMALLCGLTLRYLTDQSLWEQFQWAQSFQEKTSLIAEWSHAVLLGSELDATNLEGDHCSNSRWY